MLIYANVFFIDQRPGKEIDFKDGVLIHVIHSCLETKIIIYRTDSVQI